MILKLTNGEYIHAESYGSNSWGTDSQDSIKKRNGKWYIESGFCVDSREDRWETITTPLDVEEELVELPDGVSVVNEDDLETFYRMVGGEIANSLLNTLEIRDKEIIEMLNNAGIGMPKELQDIEQGWRKVADILYKNHSKCTPVTIVDWSDTLKKMYEIGERPKGKWILHTDDLFPAEGKMECSVCHAEQTVLMADDNYCPACGAEMEGAERNDKS